MGLELQGSNTSLPGTQHFPTTPQLFWAILMYYYLHYYLTFLFKWKHLKKLKSELENIKGQYNKEYVEYANQMLEKYSGTIEDRQAFSMMVNEKIKKLK